MPDGQAFVHQDSVRPRGRIHLCQTIRTDYDTGTGKQ